MWSTGTGRTVTCASPVTPSTVAWIRTGPPSATPLTRPDEETEAIEGLLEDQMTVRPGTVTPPEVFAVASSWRLEPRRTSDVAGVTSTLATSSTSATPLSDVLHPIEIASTVPAASWARSFMRGGAKKDGRKWTGSEPEAEPEAGHRERLGETAGHLEQLGAEIGRQPPAQPEEQAATAAIGEVGPVRGTLGTADQLADPHPSRSVERHHPSGRQHQPRLDESEREVELQRVVREREHRAPLVPGAEREPREGERKLPLVAEPRPRLETGVLGRGEEYCAGSLDRERLQRLCRSGWSDAGHGPGEEADGAKRRCHPMVRKWAGSRRSEER